MLLRPFQSLADIVRPWTKARAVCWILAWVLLLGYAPADGQETPLVVQDTGLAVLVIAGLEGVEAIADAFQGAAVAHAVVSQATIGNRVEEWNIHRRSLIQDSFKDNKGIVMVNQDSGNLNTQANVRALAVVEGAGSLVQGFDIWGSALLIGNTVISSGGSREDRIANSFTGTVGIVGVNQSAGNGNLQANVLALGIGIGVGPQVIALGNSSLAAVSADNTLIQNGPPGPRADVITDSFAGFRGIAQINQSAGDLNIVRNVFGLSVGVADVR